MLRTFMSAMLLMFAATSAQAAEVTASPTIVAKVMNGAGYETEMDQDSDGDPLIRSKAAGYNFVVYFYGCTNGRDCKTVQFAAGFDRGDRVISYEKINDWNKKRRFGRAFLDSVNDPIIQMDIDLEDGGMSSALFVDNLEYWDLAVSEYAKFIFDD